MVTNAHSVVCFGEVLWDILPTGALPGGAPMNVTYHLHKLKKTPALITRIGQDDRGKELQHIFSGFGVCTDYFQMDGDHETGKVFAEANEFGEMSYDIVKPVAWDFIQWGDELDELINTSRYFVFGSLAARSAVSKASLLRLLEKAKIKVLDINLRPPHFERGIVEELVNHADILKLNEAELELISGWYSTYTTVEDRVKAITEKFGIPKVVVTLGSDGAYYYDGKGYRHAGYKVSVADTVGSGDAFLAGFISSLMDGASGNEALGFACAMGAFIATQRGGCPEYSLEDVYDLMKVKNSNR